MASFFCLIRAKFLSVALKRNWFSLITNAVRGKRTVSTSNYLKHT